MVGVRAWTVSMAEAMGRVVGQTVGAPWRLARAARNTHNRTDTHPQSPSLTDPHTPTLRTQGDLMNVEDGPAFRQPVFEAAADGAEPVAAVPPGFAAGERGEKRARVDEAEDRYERHHSYQYPSEGEGEAGSDEEDDVDAAALFDNIENMVQNINDEWDTEMAKAEGGLDVLASAAVTAIVYRAEGGGAFDRDSLPEVIKTHLPRAKFSIIPFKTDRSNITANYITGMESAIGKLIDIFAGKPALKWRAALESDLRSGKVPMPAKIADLLDKSVLCLRTLPIGFPFESEVAKEAQMKVWRTAPELPPEDDVIKDGPIAEWRRQWVSTGWATRDGRIRLPTSPLAIPGNRLAGTTPPWAWRGHPALTIVWGEVRGTSLGLYPGGTPTT